VAGQAEGAMMAGPEGADHSEADDEGDEIGDQVGERDEMVVVARAMLEMRRVGPR
jgi:hypothetical protein